MAEQNLPESAGNRPVSARGKPCVFCEWPGGSLAAKPPMLEIRNDVTGKARGKAGREGSYGGGAERKRRHRSAQLLPPNLALYS